MDVKRPIIVSMTSWKNRIHHVAKTIFQMYKQSLKPTKIYLTLSTDEFQNKEDDLPHDLILLKSAIPEFEIKWVKENTKAFKKLIPVLSEYKNSDVWILTVDDDVFYSNTYIEFLVNNAEQHFGTVINPKMAGNWLHGAFGCYHPSYFMNQNIFKITPQEMIKFVEDDKWYSACYHANKVKDFPLTALQHYFKMEKFEQPLSKTYMSYNNKQNIKKMIINILRR